MIHGSKIPIIMEARDEKGKPKRFSLKFRKISGELVEANNVSMESYWHRNGSLNIRFSETEVRKIRLATIVEFNGKEVYL